jgi:hypothetical protein
LSHLFHRLPLLVNGVIYVLVYTRRSTCYHSLCLPAPVSFPEITLPPVRPSCLIALGTPALQSLELARLNAVESALADEVRVSAEIGRDCPSVTPLESALTEPAPLTPLYSTHTENGGGGDVMLTTRKCYSFQPLLRRRLRKTEDGRSKIVRLSPAKEKRNDD